MRLFRRPGDAHHPAPEPTAISERAWAPHESALALLKLAGAMGEAASSGRHRAPDRGHSTEFYDFRPYAEGDPARRVDWRVYARTDRAYIRRFQHEGRATLVLAVDASPSMNFDGLPVAGRPKRPLGTKLDRARELAAALAWIAVRAGDRVGLVSHGPRGVCPPTAGRTALHSVIDALDRLQPAPQAGHAHADMLSAAGAMRPPGGLLVVLTDGLSPIEHIAAPLRAALATSTRRRFREVGGGLVLVQILSDDELNLPTDLGPVEFVDPRSDLRARTDPAEIADEYQQALRNHIEQLRAAVVALGGRHFLCPLSLDPLQVLRRVTAA